MDIQPGQQISDDQELAKVLAGITASADGSTTAPATDLAGDLKKEADNAKQPAADDTSIGNPEADPVPDPASALPTFTPPPMAPVAATADDGDLESIKNEALGELRPLVDKLNVSPEEKFDTYLLLIRSTDDTSLIGPAHEAARGISDEARRAQALLDIIKEIDYFSNPQKQAA